MKRLQKKYIVLFLILIVGALFRLLCLNDPGGLWYDELVSYQEAIKPNLLYIIFYTFKTDVHLPLYPILLHYWGKVFSYSDLWLRAFSAICGILTIIFAYFAGRSLHNRKTGYFCAGLFAINSLLIYYSQEVRLYSLISLCATIFLWTLVRISKHHNRKRNFIYLIFSSLILLSTSTIGFIFVYAQLLFVLLYVLSLRKQDGFHKKIFENYIWTIIAVTILNIPNFAYFLLNFKHYIKEINGYYFDWSSLFVIIQNWFSPDLVGLGNNPCHYMATFFSDFDVQSFIFIVIPIAIALFAIFYAIKKDKKTLLFLSGSIFFFLIEIIAVKTTNFKILTRYTLIAFENVLLVVGYGLSLLDNQKMRNNILIATYFIVNLFYLSFMPNAAYKIQRNGFKYLGDIMQTENIKKNDFIVVWNRTEILDRYFDTDSMNVLSILRNFAYTSEVILNYQDKLSKMPLEEKKAFLRPYFINPYIPKNNYYLMNLIYNHMKKNQKFVITTNPDFDSFNQEKLTMLAKNDILYKQTSFNNLLSIKALVDMKEICYKQFKFVDKKTKNGYVVIVFEKP